MLIDKPDGTQIHIPNEHIELDEYISRWHARNLSRGVAIVVFIGAIVFWLGSFAGR